MAVVGVVDPDAPVLRLRPVAVDDRILIDGGTTNPLPFDQVAGRADVTVAIDVLGAPPTERTDVPGVWESVFITLNVMGSAIVTSFVVAGAGTLLLLGGLAAGFAAIGCPPAR